jgi:hypothetical protein
MTLQARHARHVGTRLLLILALAAALLAGLVAVGWAMGEAHIVGTGSQPHDIARWCTQSNTCLKTAKVGGDQGGGHLRTTSLGGDVGGGH